MFLGHNSGSLFQQFMELRKSLRNGYEKKKLVMKLKSNLSLEISKYIIIIYKTKRNYISIWIVFIKIFSKASNRRFELGETNYLEKITKAKFRQIKTSLSQIKSDRAHIMTCCIH
jgi:cobalt-zinc-cadmium resistance protein CzcA